MKPSERIREIYEKICQEHKCQPESEMANDYGFREFAIIHYLDEQWEKNQPCEHKDSYQVEGNGDVYYNVCHACGVLFLVA